MFCRIYMEMVVVFGFIDFITSQTLCELIENVLYALCPMLFYKSQKWEFRVHIIYLLDIQHNMSFLSNLFIFVFFRPDERIVQNDALLRPVF